jgi:hypothetical protein
MRIVASMTNTGWCRTDEAFRSQELDSISANHLPNYPAPTWFAASRLRLSEASVIHELSLQAVSGASDVSGRFRA